MGARSSPDARMHSHSSKSRAFVVRLASSRPWQYQRSAISSWVRGRKPSSLNRERRADFNAPALFAGAASSA